MSRRILALPAALLLLTGCGGGSDSPVTADPAPAPSTASTSVQSSPSPPAPETAEEFIRRWAETEVDMQNTGDTVNYRSITMDCESCKKLAAQVEGYYANGGYVRFGGQVVRAIRKIGQNGERTVLRVRIEAQPTKYKRSSEAAEESFAGGPTLYKVTLQQLSGSWALLGYTRLAA